MGCALALHAAHVHKGERFPHAIVLLAPFVSAASVRLAPTRLALHMAAMWSPFDVFKMKESALQQGHPLFVATGDDLDLDILTTARKLSTKVLASTRKQSNVNSHPRIRSHATGVDERQGGVYADCARWRA
jgi:hypothetical protein